MGVRLRAGFIACALVAIGLLAALPAGAYMEPNTMVGTGCTYCHPMVWDGSSWTVQRRAAAGGDCLACHADYEMYEWKGPHANYTTTSNKCEACHSVHNAPEEGVKLLPKATILATCQTCHDGTGGYGVYGAILRQTGTAPGGGHRCEVTNVVPGGDGTTGGMKTMDFGGLGDTLTCTDCHSPHNADTVAPFKGDRRRLRSDGSPAPVTSRLLRRRPGGTTTPVDNYGSDWCLACHAGRSSEGMVMNHPVEQKTATRPNPYHYGNVPILASENPTGITVMGGMGGVPFGGGAHWAAEPDNPGNRGYLMPYPRTAQQSGHAPICQQCHEDSRSVGVLASDGLTADAQATSISAADAVVWSSATNTWTASVTDNPQFQNFPHETVNANLLVEEADDLCINCHPTGALP